MVKSTVTNLISLESFEERLLDGDRWVEVVEGRFVRLSPPDDAHGDIVRNLSQALAAFLKKSDDMYACFELPMIVQKEPAIVRCPAISCFRSHSESRFAETDKLVTETRPALIIDVASTNDRREAMSDRIRSFQNWGVTAIWVIDPVTRHVHQFHGQSGGKMVKEPEVLLGHPVLPGFAMPISDLFRQPEWMKK